jgi:hypothetical protein
MKLPFTFKEFVKNPFAAIAILCVLGMGYLYIDARSAQSDILENCKLDKIEIKNDLKQAKIERDEYKVELKDLRNELNQIILSGQK